MPNETNKNGRRLQDTLPVTDQKHALDLLRAYASAGNYSTVAADVPDAHGQVADVVEVSC